MEPSARARAVSAVDRAVSITGVAVDATLSADWVSFDVTASILRTAASSAVTDRSIDRSNRSAAPCNAPDRPFKVSDAPSMRSATRSREEPIDVVRACPKSVTIEPTASTLVALSCVNGLLS